MTDAVAAIAKKPKAKIPFAIRVLRSSIALRMANQLSDDEYMLLTIIGEWQDRRQGNLPVNISRKQLCLRMCVSPDSPRRIQNAVKSVTLRQFVVLQKSELGSQSSSLYWIDILKLESVAESHKSENTDQEEHGCTGVMVTPDHLTTCHGDPPGGVMVTPREGSWQPPGGGHGDPSLTPVSFTPDFVTPDSLTPEPPTPLRKGGCVSEDSESETFKLQSSRKAKAKKSSKVLTNAEAQIEAIYQAYPLHTGKLAAIKAIEKSLQQVSWDVLMAKVTEYAAATSSWSDEEKRFIPHPATWMNQGRWNDDPKTWQRKVTHARKSLAGGAGQTHNPKAAITDPLHGKF